MSKIHKNVFKKSILSHFTQSSSCLFGVKIFKTARRNNLSNTQLSPPPHTTPHSQLANIRSASKGRHFTPPALPLVSVWRVRKEIIGRMVGNYPRKIFEFFISILSGFLRHKTMDDELKSSPMMINKINTLVY